MTTIALRETARDDDVVTLAGTLPPLDTAAELRYATALGATLAIDGVVCGAFDREHDAVLLDASPRERAIELAVERQSLPTHGLPPGDGLRWRMLLARSHREPAKTARVDAFVAADSAPAVEGVALWGHSHLDVAWLWTYDDARRKAVRTFANALDLLQRDPTFVFVQSQPQLYRFVEEAAPELFARVREAVAASRFDPSVAAMWVEPDCNLPSGESLLRQMLHAFVYCRDTLGTTPSIAWLPDTFGFPNTLPTLLAHAGITSFATTKLLWNDTSAFPHAQFAWIGPDGSTVTAALIAGMDGALDAARVRKAKERSEPVVVGFGDGGGGPTAADATAARECGHWERAASFFDRLERSALPPWRDELYLQYHRGTYTTHHDVKAENAWCERALLEVEEGLAWAHAVRAQPEMLARLNAIVDAAWQIVLRNQFHDVLPGTSITRVYDDVRAEYVRAREGIAVVRKALDAMLPRASRGAGEPARVAPVRDGDEWILSNGLVTARVRDDGSIVWLSTENGRNLVTRANLLALYRDRPAKWDAWNVDASYRKRRLRFRPGVAEIVDGALHVRFASRRSTATLRLSLNEREPFVRAQLDGTWNERHALLRVEGWFPVDACDVRYGSPHGSIVRDFSDPAKFEVPGQRYACASDAHGGVATLALDTYGWNARSLPRGGVMVGHSLLRAPQWPDSTADRGDVHLEWAIAPLDDASPSSLEAMWERYAVTPRVRLFTPDVPSVRVAACKPARDGDGVIVRIRECDGTAALVRLRCGARMRSVEAVDALERPLGRDLTIDAEALVDDIGAFALRSYRVRFNR